MDQRDFVKLTSALYRVTDLFPENEPLRFGLRERALKVLTGLAPYHFSHNSNLEPEEAQKHLTDLRTLRCLLEVSQGQKWVDEINLMLLDQEYSRLEEQLAEIAGRVESNEKKIEKQLGRQELPAEKPVESVPESQPEPSEDIGPVLMRPNQVYNLKPPVGQNDESSAPSERQHKILQMIRQQPRIQMKQIQEQLTGVTTRTLRRDLENLVQRGEIVRVGRGTGTFYQVNFVDNS